MDGLHHCPRCGNDTTQYLCRSCAEQLMIEDSVPDYPHPSNIECPEYGGYNVIIDNDNNLIFCECWECGFAWMPSDDEVPL